MDLTTPKRLDPIIYVLITNKYATLKEIRDEYSFEEVLDLYEACLSNMYNKYQSNKPINKKGG